VLLWYIANPGNFLYFPVMTASAVHSIPQFALYGEITPSHRLEPVHIEDIHERSSRNGWLIKPHRHTHLFQLLVMQNGEMAVTLDEEHQQLRGRCLVVVPAGVVHGYRFSPDTQGRVLSIAVNLQVMDAENQLPRLLEGILSRPCVFKLERKSAFFRQLQQYLDLLGMELRARQQDQDIVLFALVKLLLVQLRRNIGQPQAASAESRATLSMVEKLKQLAELHYKEHLGIADYSSLLHVSVSTLNRACRAQLGCTAKKLLQDRLHVEARRRLIYTRETLDLIADSLGYQDAAYFSRVFKALEGAAPSEFRRLAQERAKLV